MNFICQLLDGKKLLNINLKYLDVRYLRGKSEPKMINSGKYVSKGTYLILVDGENSGEVFLATEDGYMGSTFKVLNMSNEIFDEYVLYFLEFHRNTFKYSKTGSAIPHLNKNLFFNLLIPLPPLAEQKRIVEELENILPLVETYGEKQEQLEKLNESFPEHLKKSILQEAVQGKLVPQDPFDEPSSVLLERIRKEKEKLIKEGKIKKSKNESIIYRRDNSHYEKLNGVERCIDDKIPFEIPDSWEWVRLDTVFNIEMGQSPVGSTVSSNNNGIEFHQGKVHFGEIFLQESGQYTTVPKKYAEQNSVLLCVRAPVGKVNITRRRICIGRGLCAILPLADMPLMFIYYLLEAYENIFVRQATGTTFIAITAETVKNQLIPLPPLAEQKRIVEKIEKLQDIIKGL